jgi:hypothetical protein
MEKSPIRLLNRRRSFVLLGTALLGLHLAKSCLFVVVGQPPLEGDARHYWQDATRIADGDWLMTKGEVETIRTPGYPLFLALNKLAFGRYALIAATVFQQAMVFAMALASAWICIRISGTWIGGFCGLTLGLFCVSQNAVAAYMLSDTLFALLLTLAVAALVAWFERPTAVPVIMVGLLLGLATLVRPIAQFAWVPIVVAMVFRGSQGLNVRRLLGSFACALGTFAAVLAPWYARNYCHAGQCFLSKTAGVTMWRSLFKQSNGSRLDPAMPFANAPRTQALLAQLDGVELENHWEVLRALQSQKLTSGEANDRMQEVCMEAIKAHPWKFVDSRLRRFAWFWITPNGTRRPQTQSFHMNEVRPEEGLISENALSTYDYCDQAYWRWDGYFRDGKLNLLWYPNPWLYLSAGIVAACGAIGMLRNRRQRPSALAFILLLAYFGVMTAIGAPPEYRYRMPLEPILIVCAASLVVSQVERWLAKFPSFACRNSMPLQASG